MDGSRSRRALLPALVLLLAASSAAAGAEGPTCNSVVGKVGDTTMTLGELDALVLGGNSKLAQGMFDARNRALEAWLGEHLLEMEAKAQKTTAADLLRKEQQASGTITDAEIEAVYNQNKARLGGRTLEQSKDQIRGFLEGQKIQAARARLISQLKDKYGARNLLEPPRVEFQVARSLPRQGPDAAPVRIVEFSDFQ